jgi:hypothetical protein
MLYITIPKSEYFNEQTQEFVSIGPWTLQLEHSLISISKWEAKWCKAFLGKQEKTLEENIDYIRCMIINNNVDPMALSCLSVDQIKQINDYIEAPMSATKLYEDNAPGRSRDVVTSELIYYWMISLNIPFECQKWHLNKLLTLVRVCNMKNTPPKNVGKNSIYNRNSALNAARRAKLGSTG